MQTKSVVEQNQQCFSKEHIRKVYEAPSLSYHGEWQALTLQFSIPISIEEEGSVSYSR